MIVYRIIAGFFGFLVIAVLGLLYMEFIAYAGFPDGHLTEYTRAMRVLYWVSVVPGVAIAFYLFNLALGAKKSRYFFKLMMALLAILVCVVVFILIQGYLYEHISHGQMA